MPGFLGRIVGLSQLRRIGGTPTMATPTSQDPMNDRANADLLPNVVDDAGCVDGLREALGGRGPRLIRAVLRSGVAGLEVSAAVASGLRRAPARPRHLDETIAARSTSAVLPLATDDDAPTLRRVAAATEDDIVAQFSTRRGSGRSAAARPTVAPAAPTRSARSPVSCRPARPSSALVGSGAAASGRIGIDLQLIAIDSVAVPRALRFETTPADIRTPTVVVA